LNTFYYKRKIFKVKLFPDFFQTFFDLRERTRLQKVTSMNFCSAAKPVLQRSRSGFTLSGKARGAVGKRQSGGQKGATGLFATASERPGRFV